MRNIFKFIFVFLLFIHCEMNVTAQVKQQNLAPIDQMPNLPKPLQIIDFKKLAIRFNSTVYDLESKVNSGH